MVVRSRLKRVTLKEKSEHGFRGDSRVARKTARVMGGLAGVRQRLAEKHGQHAERNASTARTKAGEGQKSPDNALKPLWKVPRRARDADLGSLPPFLPPCLPFRLPPLVTLRLGDFADAEDAVLHDGPEHDDAQAGPIGRLGCVDASLARRGADLLRTRE